jgi:hypothetical protein
MNFDAFISYAHHDKAAADAACAKLEAEGIRCWIAPRDVPPGAQWAAAIVDAIDHCRAMVVIFSSSANSSKQIHREVQRAFEREVPVVPFRIENVAPEQSLAYYMGSVHWLDALSPPLEQHLQKLAASVKPFTQINALGEKDNEGRSPREDETDKGTEIDRSRPPASSTPRRPSRHALLTLCVIGVILVGSFGVWLAGTLRTLVPSEPQPAQSSMPPTTAANSNTVTLQTGLVGYWPLDGNTTNWASNITQDVSGNGNNGTMSGMSISESPAPGKIGEALKFNGRNSYIVLPRVVSGDFTISYWMKSTQTGQYDSSCFGNSQWYCGWSLVDAEMPGVVNDFGTSLGNGLIRFGIGNPDTTITSSSNVNTGKWVYVAATWVQSSGTMSLYVNGALEATTGSSSTAARTAPTNIWISRNGTALPGNLFFGTIDDLRIFNRALSAREVTQLYSMGQ